MIKRQKGTVTGIEDDATEWLDQDAREKAAKKAKDAAALRILVETDKLVAECEREGVPAHTLDVTGPENTGVKVIYSSRAKTIPDEKVPSVTDQLAVFGTGLIEEHVTVTLTGPAADRFLKECEEKLDLYADVDPDIKVATVHTLCDNFLTGRIAIRQKFPKHEDVIDKISKDFLTKPTLKAIKAKKSEVDYE